MINVTPGANDFLQQTMAPQAGPTLTVQPQTCPSPDLGKLVSATAAAVKPFGTMAAGAVIAALAYYFVPKVMERFEQGPNEYSFGEFEEGDYE